MFSQRKSEMVCLTLSPNFKVIAEIKGVQRKPVVTCFTWNVLKLKLKLKMVIATGPREQKHATQKNFSRGSRPPPHGGGGST